MVSRAAPPSVLKLNDVGIIGELGGIAARTLMKFSFLSEFKQQFDSQLNSQPHKETKAFHILLGKFSNGRDFHRFSSFQWKIQRNLCISYRNK